MSGKDGSQTQPTGTKALILDYLRRDKASQNHVQSHFGLSMKTARRYLIELEMEGLAEQRGLMWEATVNGK